MAIPTRSTPTAPRRASRTPRPVSSSAASNQGRNTLVIDVGGTHVKVLATGQKTPVKIPSGSTMTAAQMVAAVKKASTGWKFDRVAIGFPGPVVKGKPAAEPRNLGKGWVSFDFARAFGRPTRITNDAAMQALGSYNGGRMLFLGLGTGLGSALVINGILEPMELAHLPYKNGCSYEDYVGLRGLERLGKKKWRKEVKQVVALLRAAMVADDVVIGGGNAKKLKELPPGARLGENANAFLGGFRLWDEAGAEPRGRARRVS